MGECSSFAHSEAEVNQDPSVTVRNRCRRAHAILVPHRLRGTEARMGGTEAGASGRAFRLAETDCSRGLGEGTHGTERDPEAHCRAPDRR